MTDRTGEDLLFSDASHADLEDWAPEKTLSGGGSASSSDEKFGSLFADLDVERTFLLILPHRTRC
jgi:hypothetical protein